MEGKGTILVLTCINSITKYLWRSDCFKHILGNGNMIVNDTVIGCRTLGGRENPCKKIANNLQDKDVTKELCREHYGNILKDIFPVLGDQDRLSRKYDT